MTRFVLRSNWMFIAFTETVGLFWHGVKPSVERISLAKTPVGIAATKEIRKSFELHNEEDIWMIEAAWGQQMRIEASSRYGLSRWPRRVGSIDYVSGIDDLCVVLKIVRSLEDVNIQVERCLDAQKSRRKIK